MSRLEVAFALAALLCLITGCSGGGSVMAQSSYTNASLSGTYGISFASSGGSDLTNSEGEKSAYGAVGTLTFDGVGKVTSGTITTYTNIGPCVVSVTGTYSIQSTGVGTITTTPVVSSGGCTVSPSWSAHLAVTQQGASFNFASNNSVGGSAAKQ
jgi:hypothetical protein